MTGEQMPHYSAGKGMHNRQRSRTWTKGKTVKVCVPSTTRCLTHPHARSWGSAPMGEMAWQEKNSALGGARTLDFLLYGYPYVVYETDATTDCATKATGMFGEKSKYILWLLIQQFVGL